MKGQWAELKGKDEVGWLPGPVVFRRVDPRLAAVASHHFSI